MSRISHQRKMILELLRHRADHPTAAEVARAAQEDEGGISLSNLYRNLDILVREGRVRRISMEAGPDRFDANLSRHYHVLCTVCRAIWDMPLEAESGNALPTPDGFSPEDCEITIKGVCASCAQPPHPFIS